MIQHSILVPRGTDKDKASRLGLFSDWLHKTGRSWNEPGLAEYRDYLLKKHKVSTVKSYLATIRGVYRDLIEDGTVLSRLNAREIANLIAECNPRLSSIKPEVKQDWIDAEGSWLTKEQASALIASPGLDSLIGLRDTAMLALMLCTGLREGEIVKLEVRDLRQAGDDGLCLYVRHGKGNKTRAVFYGAGVWCLAIVDMWLEASGVDSGLVFRSLWKNHSLRPGRMTTRSTQKILAKYTTVRPHDLRRTYARRCYDEGMNLLGIARNLGIDTNMALLYIGRAHANQKANRQRCPPALYDVGCLEEPKCA